MSDDLLRRALPLMVEYNRLRSEVAHQQIRRALLPYAEGADLDVLGVGPPVVLRAGDPDDPYRLRIANSRLGLNIGSLPAVRQFARDGAPAITDVLAVMAPNRQDMSVWVLKAALAQLTAAENMTLLEYLRHEDRVIGGVQITAPTPTIVPYTIQVLSALQRHAAEHPAAAGGGAGRDLRLAGRQPATRACPSTAAPSPPRRRSTA